MSHFVTLTRQGPLNGGEWGGGVTVKHPSAALGNGNKPPFSGILEGNPFPSNLTQTGDKALVPINTKSNKEKPIPRDNRFATSSSHEAREGPSPLVTRTGR